MDVTDPTAITGQVQQLEAMAHGLAQTYRADLESALGTPFQVNNLTNYDWASSPEDHFYPVRYDNTLYGAIFPISKQALIGSQFVADEDLVFEKARTLLEQRGYAVYHEFMVESHAPLVELARERRQKTTAEVRV
ncbi:MAG: hypothetical protein AABX70_07855 [Nanoarchaeota archaeon]